MHRTIGENNPSSNTRLLDKKPRGDARLIIPPIGLFFCAFAFLVFYLVNTEIRSTTVLLEAQATQTASGQLESFRASTEGSFALPDSLILSFGLYKANGKKIAGFGDAPQWSRPESGDRQFTYDRAKRTLTLIRPLIAESSHRPEYESRPQRDPSWPRGLFVHDARCQRVLLRNARRSESRPFSRPS